MKIRDHGSGPLAPLGGSSGAKEQAATGKNFSVGEAGAAGFAPPAGATRADLDDPSRAAELLRASAGKMLDASPLGAAIPADRRGQLEATLASDPMMRDLLTRLLEGTLR